MCIITFVEPMDSDCKVMIKQLPNEDIDSNNYNSIIDSIHINTTEPSDITNPSATQFDNHALMDTDTVDHVDMVDIKTVDFAPNGPLNYDDAVKELYAGNYLDNINLALDLELSNDTTLSGISVNQHDRGT